MLDHMNNDLLIHSFMQKKKCVAKTLDHISNGLLIHNFPLFSVLYPIG